MSHIVTLPCYYAGALTLDRLSCRQTEIPYARRGESITDDGDDYDDYDDEDDADDADDADDGADDNEDDDDIEDGDDYGDLPFCDEEPTTSSQYSSSSTGSYVDPVSRGHKASPWLSWNSSTLLIPINALTLLLCIDAYRI